MGLAGYKAPRVRIPVSGDNAMEVRGASLTTLAVLMREHFQDLEAVLDLVTENEKSISSSDFQSIALSLISGAPGLAANIIAISAGEGDATDAAELPLSVQIHALVEIFNLTFTEVGGVKKAWEQIAVLLKMEKTKEVLKKMPRTTQTA